jgi:hypothetical protein
MRESEAIRTPAEGARARNNAWVKIKKRSYSQAGGLAEFFDFNS